MDSVEWDEMLQRVNIVNNSNWNRFKICFSNVNLLKKCFCIYQTPPSTNPLESSLISSVSQTLYYSVVYTAPHLNARNIYQCCFQVLGTFCVGGTRPKIDCQSRWIHVNPGESEDRGWNCKGPKWGCLGYLQVRLFSLRLFVWNFANQIFFLQIRTCLEAIFRLSLVFLLHPPRPCPLQLQAHSQLEIKTFWQSQSQISEITLQL